MEQAALALGSNLGDRRQFLRSARAALLTWASAVRASSLYETAPWGDTDQPAFLNVVLVVAAEAAQDWLGRAQALEAAAGRRRDPARPYGPRTLDVDVIEIWRDGTPVHSVDPELMLPHPRLRERAFVLVPLAEVLGHAELAGLGRVDTLLAALPRAPRDVRRLELEW